MLTSLSKGAILDAELQRGVTSEVNPIICVNVSSPLGTTEYGCLPSIENSIFSKEKKIQICYQ